MMIVLQDLEIVECIARDRIYKVRHKETNEEFVMKQYKREGRDIRQWSACTRCIDIDHPRIIKHVAQIYEPTKNYLIMEYGGFNLEKYLSIFREHLQIKHMLTMMFQMAEAVDALHMRNLAHCDIKTSNFVAQSETDVKMIDFDYVKCLSAPSRKQFPGTLEYMAPEVMALTEVTRASDVYSLGVTFFEMLEGTTPFFKRGRGDYPMVDNRQYKRIYTRILGAKMRSDWINKLTTAVPKELAKLLEQMMNPIIEERPTIVQVGLRLNFIYQTVVN